MVTTALAGLVEVGDIEMFRPAWWFEPFGLKPADLLGSPAFQRLLDRSSLAVTCASVRSNKPFVLTAGEPEGTLLVTPTARSGLVLLLKTEAGNRALQSLWPFVTEGIEHEVEIRRVTLVPNRLEAMIDGVLPSGMRLTWHDVLFAADRTFYAVGSVHTVQLAGIAHTIRVPENAPITIPADNKAWSAVRAHSPEGFNPDGSMTIQTKGMAVMFPCDATSPEVYDVQGMVKKVEPYTGELFGRRTWMVTITVFPDEGVDIRVYVTDHVLADRALPKVGDDFGALIRLVGRISTPNVREAG